MNLNKNKNYYVQIFLIIFFFLFFFVYTNFLEQRPYYLTLYTDVENDYYANAKLLFNNQDIQSVYHPGSLVFFLSSLIFNFTSDKIQSTQNFFIINYFLICLINLVSIIYFLKFFLNKNVDKNLLFISIILIILWPSYFVYLERLSADSYTAPVSIILSISFYKLLENDNIDYRRIIITSFISGLALSIKLSFIPIFFLILIFLAFKENDYSKNIKNIFIYIFFSCFSFIVFFLPSFSFINLKKLIINLLRISNNDSDQTLFEIQSFVYTFLNLEIFIIIFLFFLFLPFLIKQKNYHFHKKDLFLFLFIIFLFIFYLLRIDSSIYLSDINTKIKLYEYRDGICVLPFLIVFIFYFIKKNDIRFLFQRFFASFYYLSLILVIFSINDYFSDRSYFIKNNLKKISESKLLINSDEDLTTGIWLEQPSPIDFGAVSFHNWANYKFSKNKFDSEVIEKFPNYIMMEPVIKNKKVVKFNFDRKIDQIIIHKHHLKNKFNLEIDDLEILLKKKFKITKIYLDNQIYIIKLNDK